MALKDTKPGPHMVLVLEREDGLGVWLQTPVDQTGNFMFNAGNPGKVQLVGDLSDITFPNANFPGANFGNITQEGGDNLPFFGDEYFSGPAGHAVQTNTILYNSSGVVFDRDNPIPADITSQGFVSVGPAQTPNDMWGDAPPDVDTPLPVGFGILGVSQIDTDGTLLGVFAVSGQNAADYQVSGQDRVNEAYGPDMNSHLQSIGGYLLSPLTLDTDNFGFDGRAIIPTGAVISGFDFIGGNMRVPSVRVYGDGMHDEVSLLTDLNMWGDTQVSPAESLNAEIDYFEDRMVPVVKSAIYAYYAGSTAYIGIHSTAPIDGFNPNEPSLNVIGAITGIGNSPVAFSLDGGGNALQGVGLSAYNAYYDTMESLSTHHSDSYFNPSTRHSMLNVSAQMVAWGRESVGDAQPANSGSFDLSGGAISVISVQSDNNGNPVGYINPFEGDEFSDMVALQTAAANYAYIQDDEQVELLTGGRMDTAPEGSGLGLDVRAKTYSATIKTIDAYTADDETQHVFTAQNFTWQTASNNPGSVGLAYTATLERSIDNGATWDVIGTKTVADVLGGPTTINGKLSDLYKTKVVSFVAGLTGGTEVDVTVIAGM